jgi:predicted SAM-dependent methyltransferase
MKLSIGCGPVDFGKDWIHVDGGDYPHLDSKNIVNLDKYSDNTFEVIYASHVLEYFDRTEVLTVLHEWSRVLKPGGKLRIAVPDFEAMVKLYLEEGFFLKSFLGPLYGKMPMGDETIYHKTTYDFHSLNEVLLGVGFSSVDRYNWRDYDVHLENDDCSQAYLPKMEKENGTLISLNIEATL